MGKKIQIHNSKKKNKPKNPGNSLVVQWLRPCTSTAGVKGSMPVGRTKIPHVVWYGKKFGMNTFKKKKGL